MTISPRGAPASQPPMTRPAGDPNGAARSRSAGCLNEDEWEFLRATPDYDAEEMASVTLPSAARAPAVDTAPRTDPAAPAHFPEAENLVSMLGELMEFRPGGGGPAAGAAWSEVPPAEEWADLMAPHAAVPPAAPPPTHDVLRDALEAGERLGILEHRTR